MFSTLILSTSVLGALRSTVKCPSGLVPERNSTQVWCRNITQEMYFAKASNISDSPDKAPFFLAPYDVSCPAGSRLSTVADVTSADMNVCAILGEWDITHLEDGTLSGSGYNCAIQKGDKRPLKISLCIRSVKPPPAPKFFRIKATSCPVTMTTATTTMCAGGACCKVLKQWDIVALADGTISGPGYNCKIFPHDPRAPALGYRVCVRQYSDAFEKYITQFKKQYLDDDEKAERYAVFLKSQKRIADLNALNGDGDTVFGLTFTSDRYEHEKPKRGRKGYGNTAKAESYAEVLNAAPSITPKSVDWRKSRAVTPVKNQGQCGSCWAFSTAETVESAYYLSKVGADVPILFSPQQVASCVTTMDGCGGGDTAVAFQYLKGEQYGLAPASFWEYAQGLTPANTCSTKACTQKCKSHNLKTTVTDEFYIGPSAHINSFSYATPTCTGGCASQNLEQLASNLASKGPVSICVNAGAWDDYVGGVMTQKACGGYGYDDLDHCVQLVGFNTTAPKPYWIVRNSWATSWGQEGYIYLEYSKNTCGLANEAIIPTIKSSDDEDAVQARMATMRDLAWDM